MTAKNNMMGTKLLLVITLLFTLALSPAQEPEMKNIFNGKNLKGWVEPDNNTWWRASNGVLSVKSGPNKKGSILWTEKEYRNFIVQADFRMGAGTVDSGIFLRNENEQIQIGISGSLKRDMTGSPYIPGKGYPVEAENVENLLRKDGWNTMRIQAKGKEYVVWLNGQEVMTYTSEDVPDKVLIGLQLHPGNEMSIDFRNIVVAEF